MTDVSGPAANPRPRSPSKHVPPVHYADLPEPAPLGKVMGPSVLLLAGAIGSGEFVLWPYITSQVGLTLVWLVVIGVTTQYFLNMEIERYTLATGETAVTGFTRLWKPWGVLFIVMAFGAWMWPGWATGGTTTLSFALGFSEDLVPYVTIGVLLLIGAVLTVSPVVYKTVEKIQFFMVALIVLFVVYAAVALLGIDGYAALGRGLRRGAGDPGRRSATSRSPLLMGAIAFAGAGGVMNLVQSNWVRDKGLGMGARLPKVVSPFTGEEVAAPTTGYFFRRDEENMRRWKGWWKVADTEQKLTFLLIGGDHAARLHDAHLRHRRHRRPGRELRLHQDPGRRAAADYGTWLSTSFWLIGSVVLFSTNLDGARHGRPAHRRRAQDRRRCATAPAGARAGSTSSRCG